MYKEPLLISMNVSPRQEHRESALFWQIFPSRSIDFSVKNIAQQGPGKYDPDGRFVPTDVLSPRTFCLTYVMSHGRFVPTDILSDGCFVPTDVLSPWTFCPRTFCLRTFCLGTV